MPASKALQDLHIFNRRHARLQVPFKLQSGKTTGHESWDLKYQAYGIHLPAFRRLGNCENHQQQRDDREENHLDLVYSVLAGSWTAALVSVQTQGIDRY